MARCFFIYGSVPCCMLNGYTVPFSRICNATGSGTIFLSCHKIFSMRYTLSKEFIGYGHYRLTVKDESGKEKSAVTGNIDLVSRLSSELEVEREKATEEAINYVLQES